MGCTKSMYSNKTRSLRVCYGLAIYTTRQHARVDTRPVLQLLLPPRCNAEQADLVEVSLCEIVHAFHLVFMS